MPFPSIKIPFMSKSSSPTLTPAPVPAPPPCTINDLSGKVFRFQYSAIPTEIYYGVQENGVQENGVKYRVLLCHLPYIQTTNLSKVVYDKYKRVIPNITGTGVHIFGIKDEDYTVEENIKVENTKVYLKPELFIGSDKRVITQNNLTDTYFFEKGYSYNGKKQTEIKKSLINNVIPKQTYPQTTNIYDALFHLYCPSQAPSESYISSVISRKRGGISRTKRRRNTKRRRYTKRSRV